MRRPKIDKSAAQNPLDRDIAEFQLDRQAQGLRPGTLNWYKHNLPLFQAFCRAQDVARTEQVDAATLRRFLVHLAEREHGDGGRANIYGSVRAFLNWYAAEYAPAGWVNPVTKVKAPRRPDAPLDPLDLGDLDKMLATCERKTFAGDRDRALLLLLLDTGLRHAELTALTMGDVDLATGAVLVREGKGRKWRTVFAGATTRRALYAYLRHLPELQASEPLWRTRQRTPLTKSGIFQIVRRRAAQADIPTPGMHDFRRAFALSYLRNGGDVATLQRLMGHSDLRVINRYLKLLDEDLRRAHAQYSPVETLKARRKPE
jgi:site-specific recombinase XerD